MDAWLAGTALPPPAQEQLQPHQPRPLALVVVMALLRLRGFRLAIAASINQTLYGDRKATELKAFAADGKRALGLPALLAEQIEAVLAMEAARGDVTATPPWPPVTLPAQWIRDVHGYGQAIAKIYGRFDDGLATAGNGALDQLKARAADIETTLDTALGGLKPGLGIGAARLSFTEQPCAACWCCRASASTAGCSTPSALPPAPLHRRPRTRRPARPHRRRPAAAALRRRAPLRRLVLGARRRTPPASPNASCGRNAASPSPSPTPPTSSAPAPASIQMPDIHKLLRDIPRIARARAKPFAGMASRRAPGSSPAPTWPTPAAISASA